MSAATEILEYRIPARLAELNTFISLAAALEAREPENIEIRIGRDGFLVSNARLVLDVMADGAVVIARALLEFLGLKYRKATATTAASLQQNNGQKADDLDMTDVGLTSVSPTAATNGWTESPQRAEQLLMLCFETGNKVSAHFTTENASTRRASISELRDAFQLVTRLVNREVYTRLQMPNVAFHQGGDHGYILPR
ncbi:hypothetical protein GB928_007245 [Shinella curvata]|uniref:Uncharacterized protein n=1 Tax=Shinella curvata TaxID=1817964 RepID=A0ABT8XB64_9HYPH|nr:hypothetical protein [Shinella curvata]MCJ8054631.1 hypothetical protein [Shinella curvata]MDO6120974.1 hypothetical protein [Shinella curvata]